MRFIAVGGGTSGHINPAITIADALKEYYGAKGEPCEIIFVGREGGLEGELVPKAGYELRNIDAKPFPMRPGIKMIKAYKALCIGRKESGKILKEFMPDAVIGTGGYVCAPLLLEAEKRGIPVILHESNAFPGRANKLLGNKADLVLTGFESLNKVFTKAKKTVFTGNPIRSVFKDTDTERSREALGLKEGEKLVFAMGGSLGAQTINDFIVDMASDEEFKDVKFVLGSGKQQSKNFDPSKVPSNLTVSEYITNPEVYLSAADVSVTRAGAVTCAEVAAVGAVSVLIPYPYAAHDHQSFNARALEAEGAAVMVPDAEVKDRLKGLIRELLNDKQRCDKMRENGRKVAVYDCDARIAGAIAGLLEERKR